MGFFKDLKNKITGGGATVRLSVPAVKRGQPATVQVEATAKANGKVAAVYLLIRGTESAEWKENNEKVGNSKSSFETRVQIAGAQDIVEGQSYSWQGTFELPGNVQPTFRGALINHTYEIQAGLDMPGNDPDSGWVAFEVS
ncbi:MAG TPA: hypothetical protein VL856_13765 [Acidimicrobiia bacterium]|jgi:hypothetical protein|nr:hypothetical protein [Acidimicrobiia bacterium]